MDRQTILLISDMRQVCLAEILTKKGHNVRCLDIRNRETALQQLEKLKRFLDKADVLILPIPVQKVPEQEIFYDILNKNLEKKTLVMGGCFSTEQRELLTGRDIHFLDFMEDTVVTEENAVATAEGTIAELVEKSPYNIDEAKVLVTGYGYCGKAIAKRLGALGARVTVLARRKEARKEAKGDGFYAVDFAFGPEEAMGAAMVVNTVPALVVTEKIIRELPRDAFCMCEGIRHPCGPCAWNPGKICAERECVYFGTLRRAVYFEGKTGGNVRWILISIISVLESQDLSVHLQRREKRWNISVRWGQM